MANARRPPKHGALAALRGMLRAPIAAVFGSRAPSLFQLKKGRTHRPVTLRTLIERIYSEFSEDRVLAVAGGITFFFLLAIFPAIACVVALYGLFDDRGSLLEGLQMVSGFLPGGAISVLTTELNRLTAQKPVALNITVVFGFVVAAWSASGGIKSIIDGLNIAFETTETRSFLKLTINTLMLTILVVILAVSAIYFSITLQKFITSKNNSLLQAAYDILVWPFGFCLCSAVFSVIYRYGPNRVRTPWRWITWGSAFASLFWLFGTGLFAWYAENFGSYNRTYGVLGGAVGFLTWIWLSIVLLLTGAEIVCELDWKRAPKDDQSTRHPNGHPNQPQK